MAGRIVKTSTDPMCDLLGSFFTTLAHRTRIRIFCVLQGEPRPVTSIAAYAGISIANASQHLRLMRENGAVVSEKRGQSVYYRIADQRFVYAASLIRQALAENMQTKARSGRHLFSKNRNADDLIFNEAQPAHPPQLSTLDGVLS